MPRLFVAAILFLAKGIFSVLANEIAALIGGETKHIIPNPRGEFEERRKAADFTKARRLLNWSPLVDIKTGIKQV